MKIQFRKALRPLWHKIRQPIAQAIDIKSVEAAFSHINDPQVFGTQLADLLACTPQHTLAIANERVAAYSYLAHLGNLVKQFNINFVIDAGAHSGQFASTLYGYSGYRGEVHSFEPVKKYYDVLSGALSYYPGWKTYNAALGDAEGPSVIHLGKNHGGTSSLLRQSNHLKHFAPDAVLEGTQEIMVHRVDTLFGKILDNPANRVFLKLDVQGFESRVLASCGRHLEQIKMLQVEMSSISLYEGQSSISSLCTFLEEAGFALVYVCNNFGVRQSMFIDYDFIFVRREELEKMGF